MPSYVGQAVLSRHGGHPAAMVRELQHDLRALGYLKAGIDGVWGDGVDLAVRSLRIDLTHPDAPAAIRAANAQGLVRADPAGGADRIEPALADCLAALMADPAITKLPASGNPAADNAAAWAALLAVKNGLAPTPFLAAMVRQESGGRHFRQPALGDDDSFVVVGLDRNDKATPGRITSRGYGFLQHTLFHHPPTPEEVEEEILQPVANVLNAYEELREKFDHAVYSPKKPSSGADDRHAEYPLSPLRLCKYAPSDPRHLSDCRACAAAAKKVDILAGQPVHPGASLLFGPTSYYKATSYGGVPNRASFGCDWPYAARRYNGGGINSYHYQARILLNLLTLSSGA